MISHRYHFFSPSIIFSGQSIPSSKNKEEHNGMYNSKPYETQLAIYVDCWETHGWLAMR